MYSVHHTHTPHIEPKWYNIEKGLSVCMRVFSHAIVEFTMKKKTVWTKTFLSFLLFRISRMLAHEWKKKVLF